MNVITRIFYLVVVVQVVCMHAFEFEDLGELGKSTISTQMVEQSLHGLINWKIGAPDVQESGSDRNMSSIDLEDALGPRLVSALIEKPLEATPQVASSAQQQAHSLVTKRKKKKKQKDFDAAFSGRSSTRGGPFVCDRPGCDKEYTDRCNLSRHQDREHNGQKPAYTCPHGCSAKLWDKTMFDRHMKTHSFNFAK